MLLVPVLDHTQINSKLCDITIHKIHTNVINIKVLCNYYYYLLLYWAGSSADYAQGTGFVPNNHNYSKLHIKIKI